MVKQAKDYRPAFFGAVPNRAIVDTRLTGTAFRLLTLYAYHDRLSIMERRGDGCTASNKTLCGRLGCDYTTLIKLRSSLRDWGYILLMERRGGRRLERVKVIPDHLARAESWPFDQSYIGFSALETWGVAAGKVGEIANLFAEQHPDHARFVGDIAIYAEEKVGEEIFESPQNPPEPDPQYIPPRGEIYSSEEGEDNPLKGRAPEFVFDASPRRADPLPQSLKPLLPPSFFEAESPAQLGMLERAWDRVGRDAHCLPSDERIEWAALLENIWETRVESDPTTAGRALRLSGEIAL